MLYIFLCLLSSFYDVQVHVARDCDGDVDERCTQSAEDKRIPNGADKTEHIQAGEDEGRSDDQLDVEVISKPFFWIYWDDLGYMIKYTVKD